MIMPNEVAERTFHTTRFKGYSTEEVDDFMDQITEDYAALYKENAVLKGKMKVLVEKIEQYRATEDAMRAAFLTAQRNAEAIVNDAQGQRQKLMEQAEQESFQRRQELEREIAEAEGRLSAARRSASDFIQGLRGLVQSQFDFLERLPELKTEPDTVAETAAAIDSSLNQILPEGETEPTRVIDLGEKQPEQDYKV